MLRNSMSIHSRKSPKKLLACVCKIKCKHSCWPHSVPLCAQESSTCSGDGWLAFCFHAASAAASPTHATLRRRQRQACRTHNNIIHTRAYPVRSRNSCLEVSAAAASSSLEENSRQRGVGESEGDDEVQSEWARGEDVVLGSLALQNHRQHRRRSEPAAAAAGSEPAFFSCSLCRSPLDRVAVSLYW